MIKAYQLFTGDDGHSHIKTSFVAENFSTKAISIKFKETEAGSDYDWHTAPTMQFVLTLTGTLEFTVFSEEKFTLKAGEVLIATDTTGSGHTWKMLGNKPWKHACVVFAEGQEAGFTGNA